MYQAIQQQLVQDDAVRGLADSLREMFGIANTCRNLPIIGGTINVIEAMGRACLQVASLIHEYTKLSLVGELLYRIRTLVPLSNCAISLQDGLSIFQLLKDIQPRIAQCQTCCDDLTKKFDRRVNIGTNEIVADVDEKSKYRNYAYSSQSKS